MVLHMITRDKKYNNLPKDVINSLTKMITIISTIEENLFLPKDDILREINIEIGSLQRAMDVFNQYYPDKRVNLSTYIIQRKKTQALKSIETLTNPILIDRKIYEITQMYRSNFNQSLKNNPQMIEAFDMEKVAENINNINSDLISLKYDLLSKELVEKLHSEDKKIHVWTVDKIDEINNAIDLGVDNIITNNVSLVKGIIRYRDNYMTGDK